MLLTGKTAFRIKSKAVNRLLKNKTEKPKQNKKDPTTQRSLVTLIGTVAVSRSNKEWEVRNWRLENIQLFQTVLL